MSGFCMNPNFLGTLLLISLCYSIGMFFDSNKRKTNIIFFMLLLILLTGLVMTDTLSCIMGLLFVFMYIIFYSIKNKKYKKLIILTISLIVVPTALQLANQTALLQDLKLFKKQTTKMVTGKYETDYNFGSGRIYLWK